MRDQLERRIFSMDQLRVNREAADAPVIVGHAAVFDKDVDIGGWFVERVAPGAFKRAILEDDVRALFNHDPNIVLGRNRAKPNATLTLSEDATGLAYSILPPDTQAARDLLVSMERGDVSQSSFGFRVLKQEWDESGDVLKRTLLEVELWDVSPVTFPAYPQTDAGLRNSDFYRKVVEDYRKDHPKGSGLTTVTAEPIIRRDLRQRLRQRQSG